MAYDKFFPFFRLVVGWNQPHNDPQKRKMALALAFGDPLCGGAGFEVNTDFKLPLLSVSKPRPKQIVREDSEDSFIAKFLSAPQGTIVDSGYGDSLTNISGHSTPKKETKVGVELYF